MKAFRVLILALLLAGCGWSQQQDLEILKSDQNGITIRAGMATTPDRVATIYCQNMRKLMVPKGADIISDYEKIFYYACL
ncbi:MAG: hypothetical protein ABSC26_00830 [Stellaceae bacterium]|jgi:hypothetical protein